MHGIEAMAKKKPKKGEEVPSARPRTLKDRVSHPTVPGAVEHVERVVDTLEMMFKRKQLSDEKNPEDRILHNDRAYRVARRLRNAFDTVYGSIGGAMDFDRVRGGGSPGAPPPLHYREAADVLISASKELYALDHRVLTLVVCEGRSLEEAAAAIYRRYPDRSEKEEIGRVLRQGLHELAQCWLEPAESVKGRRIGVYHAPDAEPGRGNYAVKSGTVVRGRTVTATRTRIHRN